MHPTRLHLPLLYSLPGYSGQGRKVKILTNLPILFPAGPIRNAPKWHSDAIGIVHKQNAPVFIACPARDVSSEFINILEPDRAEYDLFSRQRAWEQFYMYRAARKGCIFFYLCQEALPKEFPDKVYAHITMLELGKWIERKKLFPDTRLVIGTDGNFAEWSTIEFEIKTELHDFPLYYSLEETVNAALAIATQNLEIARG